jgi:glycosyltransferase involved in cell wall biosynthesis
VATEGREPAHLAVVMDSQCTVAAFEYASRWRCPLLFYLWDLPPWRLGSGKPDWIWERSGRLRRLPRLWGGYAERPGYYSRLRFVVRRAHWVWVPSSSTAYDVQVRFGVVPERVPFCYDSERFRPTPLCASDPPRWLSVSRLVSSKNHALLIRAAALVEPRPVVQVIGQGPEGPALQSLAHELGVSLELENTWVSDEAVDEAYRRATVVVAPSRFEGFGLTPMEGLASGRPVAASDIPVHREFLGEAVQYFHPDDPVELLRAVERAVAAGPGSPGVLREVTIEAAAGRFLARLLPILKEI